MDLNRTQRRAATQNILEHFKQTKGILNELGKRVESLEEQMEIVGSELEKKQDKQSRVSTEGAFGATTPPTSV